MPPPPGWPALPARLSPLREPLLDAVRPPPPDCAPGPPDLCDPDPLRCPEPVCCCCPDEPDPWLPCRPLRDRDCDDCCCCNAFATTSRLWRMSLSPGACFNAASYDASAACNCPALASALPRLYSDLTSPKGARSFAAS